MNASENNTVFIASKVVSSNYQNRSWITAFFELSEPTMFLRNVFVICCYSLIVLISIFGNILVCYIVIRNCNMRSATYVFITNLALSDLMMTVLNIPLNVARLLLKDWPFGSFMCSFAPLMQVTSVYVSTFTMMCIAVDRYRHVSQPFRPRLKPLRAIKVMIGVWLASLLLSIPHAIFNKVDTVFTYRTLIRCRAVYPENASRWITLTTVSTQYILPLAVTGVLYCIIVARVWSRHVVGFVTEAQIISHTKSKRTTIKMLMCVVIFFAICWMPLNLFHLLHEFEATQFIYKASMPSTVFFACHWLAMSSVCYNPFIYCWLNENFRSGTKSFLHCLANIVRKMSSFRSSRHDDTPQTTVTETVRQEDLFPKSWKHSSRKAMMSVKYYSPNERNQISLMNIKFYSVSDFNMPIERISIRELKDRGCKSMEFEGDGIQVHGLRRSCSSHYI